MQVIRAEALGMCFGVRDALEIARQREDAAEITVYGELVHNETVLEELRALGFELAPERGREAVWTRSKLLITAHGISNRERARLEASGRSLVDTTCPLVQKLHNAALRLQEAGYFPVVIGKHGHVEVDGIVGDLDEFAVIETVAQARASVMDAPRIGIVCQTTFPAPLAREILAALRFANSGAELRFIDTICGPTRRRQEAVQRLLRVVDSMVVVGGHNSNNTRQLLNACGAAGVRAVLVQGPEDLDPDWFAGCSRVGLSAGTSTLAAVVDRVEVALCGLRARKSLA